MAPCNAVESKYDRHLILYSALMEPRPGLLLKSTTVKNFFSANSKTHSVWC